MVVNYKNYVIESVEVAPSQWVAKVRKADGSMIQTIGSPPVHELSTMRHFKEEDAIAEWKRLIDAGGMK